MRTQGESAASIPTHRGFTPGLRLGAFMKTGFTPGSRPGAFTKTGSCARGLL